MLLIFFGCVRGWGSCLQVLSNRHETLNECWFYVGPSSTIWPNKYSTLVQRLVSAGWWLKTTFQAWIYCCHLHKLQTGNCCRNYQFVLDEDDLKWVRNEKKYCYYWNSSMKIFVIKRLGWEMMSFFRDAKWCLNTSWGFKPWRCLKASFRITFGV